MKFQKVVSQYREVDIKFLNNSWRKVVLRKTRNVLQGAFLMSIRSGDWGRKAVSDKCQ